MNLSETGKIAYQYWHDIPIHFPFILIDEFVIMPNHVHGIVIIEKNNNPNSMVGTPNLVETPNLVGMPNLVETPNLGVSTTNPEKRQQTINASQKWKPGSLGVVINQYKRAVTIDARKIYPGFEWQTRFHDHIIQNDTEYQRIKKYIINNPVNWYNDKLK